MSTDSTGRRLHANTTPTPRWLSNPDFIGPCQYAPGSFVILDYIGYFRKDELSKGQHRYLVMCRYCRRTFERGQASILRSEQQKCTGCHHCAKTRHRMTSKEIRTEDDRERLEKIQEWLFVMSLMPVTSIRIRAEMNRCFDSEKSRVLGWRMI